jgi:hypothetical protein
VNDNETAPRKHRGSKVAYVLITLLLIGAAAFVLFRLSLRSRLETRIDAIRAAGYPVTCAELNEWYAIPEDAQNAAYTIIDAFSYYHEPNQTEYESLPIVGRAKLPARTEPLAEETKALVAQCIADNNQALELLHQAATIKHCRYPVDFSLGLGMPLGHLSDLKRSIKLSNLEAVSHAENDSPVRLLSYRVSNAPSIELNSQTSN